MRAIDCPCGHRLAGQNDAVILQSSALLVALAGTGAVAGFTRRHPLDLVAACLSAAVLNFYVPSAALAVLERLRRYQTRVA